MIVMTDRRVWACAIFLCIVFLVWAVTGAWRESPPAKGEELWRVKSEEEHVVDMVKAMNKDVKEAQEENDYLKDKMTRIASELKVGKEEVDWHVNTLINKLNSMSEKVTILTSKVGEAALDKQKLESKIAQANKKKKKKKVSGAEL